MDSFDNVVGIFASLSGNTVCQNSMRKPTETAPLIPGENVQTSSSTSSSSSIYMVIYPMESELATVLTFLKTGSRSVFVDPSKDPLRLINNLYLKT